MRISISLITQVLKLVISFVVTAVKRTQLILFAFLAVMLVIAIWIIYYPH